jgi:hypothetical protein
MRRRGPVLTVDTNYERRLDARLDILFERMSRHQSWPCARCGKLRDHLADHPCRPDNIPFPNTTGEPTWA